MAKTTPWNDDLGEERTARLKELWPLTDRSTDWIAAEITRQFGREVGKSSVIGKARRLKLTTRKDNAPRIVGTSLKSMAPAAQEVRAQKKPTPPTYPPLRLDPMPTEGVEFENLKPGQCKWPLGLARDPVKFFCAAPTHGNPTYCAKHVAVAFSKPVASPAYYEMIARKAA